MPVSHVLLLTSYSIDTAAEHSILQIVLKPVLLHRWWQNADAPWQLLAVCYDLKAALDSGNPANYRSKIPVHQDGSCNRQQHYAALARDESGGRAVNLLPVDKPQVLPLLTCTQTGS